MFGRSMMREFDDDPFFSGFRSHRDVFDSMGRFPDPFMAVTDGGHENKKERRGNRDRGNEDRRVGDPFGGFFHSMNSMMSQMHKQMADLQTKGDSGDPNIHSFTSSNVMTYRNDGKSEPKYYQASTSTRCAPGNIKETRRTVRDSESGMEKMAVGHHIGERGKVIERRRNKKGGGGIEEERNYVHMGEEDEANFDRDWRDRTSTYNLDYGRRVPARGLAAPTRREKGPAPVAEPKKRVVVKTPAVAGRGIEPPRPHGPSKSGRARSKY